MDTEKLLKNLKLTNDERKTLQRDIESQDFNLLSSLYKQMNVPGNQRTLAEDIRPIPFKLAEDDPRREMWRETGDLLLENGQVAVFLLAGGQGSRLGFEGPKGAFDIGLPSHKTLFQLQAERIQRMGSRVGKNIPWCIMTSPLNHKATVEFFEHYGYFGLNREDVRFFEQGTMCALTEKGEPIKSEEGHLALVPDGNGGCFRALSRSGTLAWLIERGIRYVFVYSIDNVLVRIADPVFLGSLASNGHALSASKVVRRRNAEEKVGVFALKNGKPGVIEYSDIPDNLRNQKLDDGSLLFDGGNIAIHLFKIEALRKLQDTSLPWHAAGKTVCGHKNAWKFEQFLFDAFPILGSMNTFGVLREDEFAPIKNAEGEDSPASARRMLGKLHKYWLQKSKAKIKPEKFYEISPFLSSYGEGITNRIFEHELGENILEFDP